MQIVTLQPFRLVNVIPVTVLPVAVNVHVKDVLDGFLVIVERAQRQFLTVAQSAFLPKLADFLERKAFVSAKDIYQPDIAPEEICCHNRAFLFRLQI